MSRFVIAGVPMHPRKNANPMIDKIFFFTMYASLVAQLNTSTEQVCSFQFSLTWPLLGAPVPRTRILTRRTLSSCSQHEAPKVKTARSRPTHPSIHLSPIRQQNISSRYGPLNLGSSRLPELLEHPQLAGRDAPQWPASPCAEEH